MSVKSASVFRTALVMDHKNGLLKMPETELNRVLEGVDRMIHELDLWEAGVAPPPDLLAQQIIEGEALALMLIAKERAKQGMPALVLLPELSFVARNHSKWLLAQPLGVRIKDPLKQDGKYLWQVARDAGAGQFIPFEVTADFGNQIPVMHERVVRDRLAYNRKMLDSKMVNAGVGVATQTSDAGTRIALTVIYAGKKF